HAVSVGGPDENIIIVLGPVTLVHLEQAAALSVSRRNRQQLGVRYRRHGRTDSGEHFTVRVQAFTGPKGQFIADHTGYRGTANAAEIRRLNHNGDARGKFDFITTFGDYHRTQDGNVVQDGFDILEHDAGLFFVSGQAHDG